MIEFVRADSSSSQYDPLVQQTMKDLVGKPLDKELVRSKLSSLYALDRFETIDYQLIEDEGRAGLQLDLRRKSWGPNYVRMGLNLEDDFEGNSRYNAAVRFIATELNPLGGEWLTDIQIGENPKFFTEFYQPLSLASRYFVAPQFDFEERSVFELRDQRPRRRVSRARGLGRARRRPRDFQLGRAALRRASGHGAAARADRRSFAAGDRVRSRRLFHAVLVRQARQHFLSAPRPAVRYRVAARSARASAPISNFDILRTSWLIARSFDRHTLVFWTDAGTTVDALATPENSFTLGGFLNLSGLTPGFLAGPHYGIGRLMYYRRIGRGGAGVLDLPAYAGVSLEAGNTWLRPQGHVQRPADRTAACSSGSIRRSDRSTWRPATTKAGQGLLPVPRQDLLMWVRP